MEGGAHWIGGVAAALLLVYLFLALLKPEWFA
jgi:K+-transporting ATPase KdpF subunit